MIVFDRPGGRFNYRTAGVAVRDGHVLIHRFEHDNFWSLPGGRVEVGETAPAALRRELYEELTVEVEVGRLLWTAECFFTLGERRCHELGLYFAVALPDEPRFRPEAPPWPGREGHLNLIFRWQPLDRLDEITLYPVFLRTGLLDLAGPARYVTEADNRAVAFHPLA